MLNIRCMIRRDLPEVVEIERLNAVGAALTEEDILAILRQQNIIGMVVEEDETILGFMLYGLNKIYLELFMLQTHLNHTGKGVATKMVDKLISKLNTHNTRGLIFTQLRESNLAGLCFAKKKGFSAISINKNAYSSPEDDGIFLKYAVFSEKEEEMAVLEDIVL